MSDLISLVNSLRRPRLLLNAAKIGLRDYNQEKALKRISSTQSGSSPKATVCALINAEDTMEQARQSGDASYVPSKHVEVFIALLGEMRRLCQPPTAA